VKPENIQLTGICTYAHADEYFSARRLGVESGRIFTGILMK
jgi:copper oxidase (laccase) domain-containing protein